MKQHVYAAAAALVLGLVGLSSNVKAESCAELAENTARALVQQYCKEVKDAEADQLVILPPEYIGPSYSAPTYPRGEAGVSSGRFLQCTRTHSLTCKQRMADMIGNDKHCNRLLYREFSFDIKDEFKRTSEYTDSMSYYKTLQLEGCHLH